MIFSRSRPLTDLCAEFAEATLRPDGRAAARVYRRIERVARQTAADELTAGLAALVPAVRRVAWVDGDPLIHLVAVLIEHGADPAAVLSPLVERVAAALELTAGWPALREKLGEAAYLPAHRDNARLGDQLSTRAAAAGLNLSEVQQVIDARLVIDVWTFAVVVALQQRRVRQALPYRDRLTAAATAMAGELANADMLLGLLHVVDDEPLLVLHRETGRAYELTIGGVGDNRQFQMLLAATLIGDPAEGLLTLAPPVAAWVAAATTGEPLPRVPFEDRFSLVDVSGAQIGDNCRPADFTVVDGRRVVVLDPPPYTVGWTAGRPYVNMVPEIRLDRVLPPDEAAAWAARVSSAQPR